MHVIIEILWLICRIIYADLEALVGLFVRPKAKNIRGKVAVVTGAGRGIGREIALQLAKKGARVAVWDIDEESSLQTSNLIKNVDGISIGYKCDVTSTQQVSEVAAKVREDLGEVDILVNNAGVLVCKSILDLTEKEIRRTFEINAVSQFWTVKEFLPHMLSQNDGHIIIIASMAAKAGNAFLTDYGASKYAANGFSESVYAELRRMKKTGIKLTTVYPMFVNTRLVTDLNDRVEARDRFTEVLTPEEVARAAVHGALRNNRYVYIPPKMKIINILAFLPQKAHDALFDFLGAGFYERAKSS